jgi:hypothetical protein
VLQLREPRARSPRDNSLVDSRSVLLAPVATQYPAGRQLPVLDAAVRQRPSDASVPEFSVPGMDAPTARERRPRPEARSVVGAVAVGAS